MGSFWRWLCNNVVRKLEIFTVGRPPSYSPFPPSHPYKKKNNNNCVSLALPLIFGVRLLVGSPEEAGLDGKERRKRTAKVMRARSCQELRGWEQDRIRQQEQKGSFRAAEDAGGLGAERLPPAALGGLALAGVRSVGAGGGVSPSAAVTAPDESLSRHLAAVPSAGRRERDLPTKQQASLQFKDNMPFTGAVPSSSPFWFKGQNCHLR